MGEKLHESDRLVIARQPVPEELAPVDYRAGGGISKLTGITPDPASATSSGTSGASPGTRSSTSPTPQRP